MNVEVIFKRFAADWQKFALMGLGPFLVHLGAGALVVMAAAALFGTSVMTAVQADLMGHAFQADPLAMMASALGFVLMAVLVGVVAGGLSQAGLTGAVVGYRRGEEVNLGSFWAYATGYFGKILLLGVLFVGVMLLSMLLILVPILGWLALFIWIPTASVILGVYPAYLIIAHGHGVTEAFGIGFRVLTSQFGEALLGGAIMLGMGILLGMVGAVPVIGWLIVALFGQPLLTYFFIERFESVVRPNLRI